LTGDGKRSGVSRGDLLIGLLDVGVVGVLLLLRVMVVYCMRPLAWMWSGWPTMQVEVSEVSRMLQFSIERRSPLQM
jgi:hypothetical protein